MFSARKKAYLALIITSVIWGIAPPVIKYTQGIITTDLFLFYRFLITSLLLLPIFIYKKAYRSITLEKLFWYVLIGCLSAPLCLIFLFYGIEKTTAVDASVISITAPIIIILGGYWFLKEKITHQEKIGIALAITGTLFTIIQPIFGNISRPVNGILGNGLVFLGTIANAAYILLYKRVKSLKLDPFVLTTLSFILGLWVLLPFVIAKYPGVALPLPALPGILFMSVLSSALAYYLYNYGVSKIEASEASLFTYLQPIFAVPISVVFLKESIDLWFVFGSMLIIGGVFVAEKR